MKGRFFAGFGAALFLVTSSALTVAVILTLTSHKGTPTTTTSNKSSQNAVGTKLQGFTPLTTKLSHLEISDLQKGTGPVVKSGATVKANYIGALADNGIIFDTSTAHGGPITIMLVPAHVIEGWVLGIPGMRVGGTRELLIPASLAYGAQGNSSIPPNSDLVFLVTIVGTN
jgi:FKBP-type peptidyl-prolyl cis-trans isomerase